LLPDDLVVLDDTRGMRSLLALLGPESPACRAARVLLAAHEPLLLCTGFPVQDTSETDGPAGTVALARALRELGRDVTVVSWAEALAAWAPALGALPTRALRRGRAPERLSGALVTVEACGRTATGAYLNVRGEDVRERAPWFEDAVGTHALVSFGDGGNEFGMGSAPSGWFEARRVEKPASTCDVLVVGQVSNWAVLAVVAALGRVTDRDLLPLPDDYQALLEALAANGVVDGVRRVAEPTEDGFELGRARAILVALRRWLSAPG